MPSSIDKALRWIARSSLDYCIKGTSSTRDNGDNPLGTSLVQAILQVRNHNMCFLCAGINVNYKGNELHCFSHGNITNWLLLLLWNGDHPAQCEVCKSKGAGGKKGCRRCKLSEYKC